MIKQFENKYIQDVIKLWNESVSKKEVLYKPIDENYFNKKFLSDPNYDPRFAFVYEQNGEITGFIQGVSKKVLLIGEDKASSPGYLTCIFVRSDMRRKGIGTKLLCRLQEEFKKTGKTKLRVAEGNPINLDWVIPGTSNHDHNNAPGVDFNSIGYHFLLANGFTDLAHEVAMYLDLSTYVPWSGLKQKQQELLDQGIFTGRYDPNLNYDYAAMCKKVGSDYWRTSIETEIKCWKENVPNKDIRFIPNGKIPKGPRPILAATYENKMVGFTGPVDKQASGRGWFTGICTDPDFERRGIATVLFNLLMQEFIQIGASFSSIFTGEDNRARRIYERTGFKPVRKWAVMSKDI